MLEYIFYIKLKWVFTSMWNESMSLVKRKQKLRLVPNQEMIGYIRLDLVMSPRWSNGKSLGSLPKWLGFKALGGHISLPGFGSRLPYSMVGNSQGGGYRTRGISRESHSLSALWVPDTLTDLNKKKD